MEVTNPSSPADAASSLRPPAESGPVSARHGGNPSVLRQPYTGPFTVTVTITATDSKSKSESLTVAYSYADTLADASAIAESYTRAVTNARPKP